MPNDTHIAGAGRASAGRRNRRGGFTLVELMIVVAIIGVISSIAIPSMQDSARRARRSEAFLNLKGIYTAQKIYFTEEGRYGSTFDQIGFEIAGATPLDDTTIQSQFYTYTLQSLDVDGVSSANYSAVAAGDLDPSDAMLDIIMIESGVVVISN